MCGVYSDRSIGCRSKLQLNRFLLLKRSSLRCYRSSQYLLVGKAVFANEWLFYPISYCRITFIHSFAELALPKLNETKRRLYPFKKLWITSSLQYTKQKSTNALGTMITVWCKLSTRVSKWVLLPSLIWPSSGKPITKNSVPAFSTMSSELSLSYISLQPLITRLRSLSTNISLLLLL